MKIQIDAWELWVLVGIACAWIGLFGQIMPIGGFGIGIMTAVIFMNWNQIRRNRNYETKKR